MKKTIRCTTHFHACDCREEYFKNLEEANKVLIGKLNESVNILKDGCLVYDQFVPSRSSSFRSDAQWFIDTMARADEILGEAK